MQFCLIYKAVFTLETCRDRETSEYLSEILYMSFYVSFNTPSTRGIDEPNYV